MGSIAAKVPTTMTQRQIKEMIEVQLSLAQMMPVSFMASAIEAVAILRTLYDMTETSDLSMDGVEIAALS